MKNSKTSLNLYTAAPKYVSNISIPCQCSNTDPTIYMYSNPVNRLKDICVHFHYLRCGTWILFESSSGQGVVQEKSSKHPTPCTYLWFGLEQQVAFPRKLEHVQ